ncbi:GNAT family N-acetyltransferase [Paracoccus sp. CPCC 101403]|uniref:GNAT family N-acetyltransferase n=1 Tax=Paracoccus broussonetiae TaxID=3075834 RepID=A0ABU3E9F6_9RHOB|nr:GNAT family N-acetyltransferase [Paracoccus sp. CPCC 101403]MDT1060853.1 GNAT family N-acetyltransferase [Paracoccus sp. CPCC 101403]
MEFAETLDIGGYELSIEPMTPADIPRLHELSVAVSWPHRADDWAMVIGLGHGWVARDQIGRIFGSAMWFPFSRTVASIGMVITSPRMQDQGAGRWLMRRVLDETQGRARVLNATKEAFRLYVSLGFKTLAPVAQRNGIVTACPDFGTGARPMRDADRTRILELDTNAMGVARPEVMWAILGVSEGMVIEREGRITGFALMRHFGRGRVIGPIVAESEQDAIALCGPFVAAHQGDFLRVDTREPEGTPFTDFLSAAGIVPYDAVQRMSLEPLPEPTGPARTFGLINQALG